jgi:hypothetical protein
VIGKAVIRLIVFLVIEMMDLKTQWDVQYPYLVWLEWYRTLRSKYPERINDMAPFTGTALMTTKAVIEERLTKINAYARWKC